MVVAVRIVPHLRLCHPLTRYAGMVGRAQHGSCNIPWSWMRCLHCPEIHIAEATPTKEIWIRQYLNLSRPHHSRSDLIAKTRPAEEPQPRHQKPRGSAWMLGHFSSQSPNLFLQLQRRISFIDPVRLRTSSSTTRLCCEWLPPILQQLLYESACLPLTYVTLQHTSTMQPVSVS